MATNNAVINISSTTIQDAGVGLQSGTSGDTISTAINANGVNLLGCPIDIMQRGLATLNFVGGTI